MDPRTNPDYLKYLTERLVQFTAAFERFMALHVENTDIGAVGRGVLPAVFPKDGSDPAEIADIAADLNHLAGTLTDLSSVTDVKIGVQGHFAPVDPFVNWETIRHPKPLLEASHIRGCLRQAAGRLESLAARAAALESPDLDPVKLHPLVWASAQRLWNDGHLRQAVSAAGGAVTDQMKTLTGRNDAPDTSLWQQAFSASPPEPEKPRLRWPGNPDDQDVKTLNEGLRLLSAGANMVIRNPATHVAADLTEQDALERLATLSLLARLVDGCVVQTIDE